MSDYPEANQELELIEISLKSAKAKVEMAEALKRLQKNRDFKRVFLDHFLGTEVARTVKLMADPNMQSPQQQEILQKMLISVGQVDQFMRVTLMFGDMALQSITDDEDAQAEILAGSSIDEEV